MRLGISLLGVNEMREFGGVPDEKDGGIVKYPIEVSLFCPKLYGESTRITRGIGRAGLAANRRKTYSCSDFLTNRSEKQGGRYVT